MMRLPSGHPQCRYSRRGFGIAAVLYLIGLVGVAGGILFSNYVQSFVGMVKIQNGLTVRNDLMGASASLAAQSMFSADNTILCPPRSVHQTIGDPCAAAPVGLVQFQDFPNTQRLPTNYANAGSTGLPTEVGVFAVGTNKQLDSYGHTYIYCRWENTRATPAAPAFVLISAGADGILQTSCGDTVAQGDNYMISFPVAEAITHASLWQPDGTTNVSYGAAGSQVTVDASGDLTAAGTISAASAVITNGITAATLTTTGDVTAKDFVGSGMVSGSLGSFGTLNASSAAIANGITAAMLTTSGDISGMDLSVSGAVSGNTGNFATLNASGAITGASGTFTTLNGTNAAITNSLTAANITASGIVTGETGTFTTLNATNATVSGNSNLGATTVSSLTNTGNESIAGTLAVTGATTGSSATYTGIVTAAGFSGTMSIGSGGVTFSGVLPIANGGTGANNSASALVSLGITSGGYLSIPLPLTGVTAGACPLPTVATNGLVTACGSAAPAQAAGTTGDIQFNNSGTLGAASNFDWDNVNGRLGIGTSSPQSQLDVEQTMTAASGSISNIYSNITLTPSASGTPSARGVNASVTFTGSNSVTGGNGAYGSAGTLSLSQNSGATLNFGAGGSFGAINYSNGTTTNAYGVYGLSQSSGGTGTIANGQGGDFFVWNQSGATYTNAAGIATGVQNSSTGTITTGYGVLVNSPVNSGGGTFGRYYGVWISTPTAAGTNFALYSQGGINYFGGNVGIGTSSPAGTFDVEGGTATANTAGTSIKLVAQNAGTGNVNGGNIYLTTGTGSGTGYGGAVLIGSSCSGASWLASGLCAAGDIYSFTGFATPSYQAYGWGTSTANISGVGGGSASDQIRFITNSVERARFDGSGHFGFATTNPQNTLDISGAVAIGASYAGTSASPANGLIVQGNVGIGTAVPVQLVDVENTAMGAGDAIYAFNSGAGNSGSALYGTNSSSAGFGVAGFNTGGGNGVYGTGATGVYGQAAASLVGNGVRASNVNVNNTGSALLATNSGTTNSGYAVEAINNSATGWGIYSSGTSPNYFAGKVGIGTTSPQALLDVTGNGTGSFPNSNGSLSQFSIPNGNYWATVYQDLSSSNRNYDIGISSWGTSDGKLGIVQVNSLEGITFIPAAVAGNNADDILAINSNLEVVNTAWSAVYLFVNDVTGNTGLGTSSPASTLSVKGGVAIGTTYAATNAAGSNNLIVQGNVGIGTTTPAATLDVNGTLHLKEYGAAPATCSASQDGVIALTALYTICVCKNGTGWVTAATGSTSCTW